jgi:ankyrin repeat protein
VTVTPLIAAVLANDTNKIAQLINSGINVNQKCNGQTALHYAIKNRKTKAVELLIKSGADLKSYDSNNKSAMELIFSKFNQRTILRLIKLFRSINERDGYEGNTALHYAAQENYHDCAAQLLAFGADFTIVNHSGQTPVYLAVANGSAGIVELLVRSGADVNFGDKNGYTPIFQAVFRGDVLMIALLVRLGTDVDHVDAAGWTPLFYAIQKADDQAVQLLLMHSRNVEYECVVRYSAVGLAEQIRDDTCRELISGRIENKLLIDGIFADNGVVSTMLF